MKSFILLFILISTFSYCQVQETKEKLVNQAKTTKSAKTISKWIVGVWEFDRLMDSKKTKAIQERKIKVSDSITATEFVERPSIEIKEDGTYVEYNCPEDCETGTWTYDKDEKVLKFKFKEPKYNVPIDKLAPGLLEKRKTNG